MTITTRDLIAKRAQLLREQHVGPNDGAFPLPTPAPDVPLVAVTVFTEYQLPGGGWASTCVCGELFLDQVRQVMRKRVAGHRCCDALGGPAPLLPPRYDQPDQVDDDTVERVLYGLRGLL